MKYCVGTWFNFTIGAELAETIKLQLGRAGSLNGLEVSDAAFDFAYVSRTEIGGATVEHGEEPGVLYLHVPELKAGEYRYELCYTDGLGERGVLLHGTLTALSRAAAEAAERRAEAAEQRVLNVTIGQGHDVLELRWSASSLAAKYAADAREAVSRVESALPKLELALKLAASFEAALREVVTVRNDVLYIAGQSTGHVVKGADGATPEYNPSDGYLYVNGKKTARIKGEDGLTPYITEEGLWAMGSVVTNVRAAGRDGLDGRAMRRVLIGSTAELPAGEETGVYYYVPLSGGGYDVYVWLENAGWTCVGEANDVATKEVHGLVQLRGGAVGAGADVGWAEGSPGAARVPLASKGSAGVGKVGVSEAVDNGTLVAFNSSNEFVVPSASGDASGTVRLSSGDTFSKGGLIGMDDNGRIVTLPASSSRMGAVKVGGSTSNYPVMPYSGLVQQTQDNCLFLSAVPNGAVRIGSGFHWQTQPPWVKKGIASAYSSLTMVGLASTEQFDQTLSRGLELLPATTELLAGVYMAETLDDERPEAVPSAAMVKAAIGGIDFAEVYTKSDADEQFAAKSELEGLATKAELKALSDDVVHDADGLMRGMVLTEEEYNALGSKFDETMIYILV